MTVMQTGAGKIETIFSQKFIICPKKGEMGSRSDRI